MKHLLIILCLMCLTTAKAQSKAPQKPSAIVISKQFVDIVGESLDGKKSRLSDFIGKGKYVLVDMWASWCPPCKAEIPNIASLHKTYKDKGLVVVGVATWDKTENIAKAVKELGITWQQIIDVNNDVTNKYGVKGIPHIILFAPDGSIVARNLRGQEMIDTVSKTIKNKR